MMANYTVKEAGFAYLFVSNEHPQLADVFFDDVTMTLTPSNVLQSSEYYPFGMQTAKSWTRDNTTNNFLYNGGAEAAEISGWYDLYFRNYDPVLGRMLQVDPAADKYSSLTPYNYAFNDPVFWNDPLGADPRDDINASRNYDMERNYYNTYGIIGDDDMYGTMFGRLGPGDGGALRDLTNPIAGRLEAIQEAVVNGAEFKNGQVYQSVWLPSGTYGLSLFK